MNYLERIRRNLRGYLAPCDQLDELRQRLNSLQRALGRVELRQQRENQSTELRDHEFQVFSQWGEDGIIQYLLKRIEIPTRCFVEFGVQNYTESNTRFLLENDNWSGLVIDASAKHIDYIKRDPIYWRHNLKADCAFIDRQNINQIIQRNGLQGDIGLLSIDIDGNDYWVWEAITEISPRVVICEYNSLFGSRLPVTVPYRRDFDRHEAHVSGAYYGASIAALARLGDRKGYALVGSNSTGANSFFVRKDVVGDLPTKSPQQAYVKSEFRDSRNAEGELTFADFDARLALIVDLPLYDIENDRMISVRDVIV